MKGVIKTFVPEKKFGFIKGDDDKDYFFHQASFKQQRDKENICDGAFVDFEPIPTPKGYRAENCSLIAPSDVITYAVPNEFLTSKIDNIKGWEIIEMGNWIIHGTSRVSPDAAKSDLIDKAIRVRANALICVDYYKSTGSEAGTGSGTHHYTIHNFRARIVTVARKSCQGDLCVDDLLGMNQSAEAERSRLVEVTVQSKRKRNIIINIMWAILIGLSVFLWVSIGNWGVAVFAVIIVTLLPGIIIGQSTDYDYWLQSAHDA